MGRGVSLGLLYSFSKVMLKPNCERRTRVCTQASARRTVCETAAEQALEVAENGSLFEIDILLPSSLDSASTVFVARGYDMRNAQRGSKWGAFSLILMAIPAAAVVAAGPSSAAGTVAVAGGHIGCLPVGTCNGREFMGRKRWGWHTVIKP